MPAGRAMWKGYLRFNLVVVRVAAHTAMQSGGGIAFNQIHRGCNQRIRLIKTCPVHGEVRNDEIVNEWSSALGLPNWLAVNPGASNTSTAPHSN
jgi:non-homologous end joining protein Ku